MQSYGRYDIMRNTILRISDVCTAFQDEGIAIRFLNFNRDKDYNGIYDTIERNWTRSSAASILRAKEGWESYFGIRL